MNKMIRFIHTYLLVGLPFVIALMIWSTLRPENEVLKKGLMIKTLYEVLSWNLMLWFAVLILFLILLAAVPAAREKSLRRLANLQERDEREEYITGRASRAAYLSTLSLTIFFLFFSIFSLNICRMPPNKWINHKYLSVSISVGFSLFDSPKPERIVKGEEVLFSSKNLLLSTSSILLILLVWQLLVFNHTARKEQMKGLQ